MNTEQINELAQIMCENKLRRIVVNEADGTSIELERAGAPNMPCPVPPPPAGPGMLDGPGVPDDSGAPGAVPPPPMFGGMPMLGVPGAVPPGMASFGMPHPHMEAHPYTQAGNAEGDVAGDVSNMPAVPGVPNAPVTPSAGSSSSNTPSNTPNITHATVVSAPMVGVFYAAPSPGAEPFVRVGDRVTAGQTLCIVEAMKVMNEVTSEVDGEVVEICVADGDLVEYGSCLMKIC